MINTFLTSFELKNTYRVNTIIYSIKQIPILKRFLSDKLYTNKGIKIFAYIISLMYEIVGIFFGKFIYIATMIFLSSRLYKNVPDSRSFVHIFLFLTIIGSYLKTFLFSPSKDKYYALVLMRMDARKFAISDYAYSIIKTVVGFTPLTLIFGLLNKVPLLICLLLPYFIAAIKLIVTSVILYFYDKTDKLSSGSIPAKISVPLTLILVAAAYGLPYLGITVPVYMFAVIAALIIVCSVFSVKFILKYNNYTYMYKNILSIYCNGMDINNTITQITQEANRKVISDDKSIESKRKGFEFFNELFVKRHKKILWKPALIISACCMAAFLAAFIGLFLNNDFANGVNKVLIKSLSIFLFIMYLVNRGQPYTQALFMNCDHSMLTFSFYKKPSFILRLFSIRLREIIKINLLPSFIIGFGLSVLLYFSGGTNFINYIIIPVSVISMSVFFSVHNLTIYYLLQPYNTNTEIKSAMYKIITGATYICCYLFMQIHMNSFVFGLIMISFSLIYCIVSCVLVYKLAYKTFKLRY